MKRKVGAVIIMHPGQCNYGSSLQGYATAKKVADFGYEYEICLLYTSPSPRDA